MIRVSRAEKKAMRVANSKESRKEAKQTKKASIDECVLKMINKTDVVFNIFGSPNGSDVDVLVSITREILDLSPCYIERARALYSEKLNKADVIAFGNGVLKDVNLVYIGDGVIKWVEHGTIWETTNSLLDTYHLHPQEHKCFVSEYITPSQDQINKKLQRSVRNILSMYTRSVQYRDITKEALLSTHTLGYRLEVIRQIDNQTNTWMDNRNDVLKINTQTKRGCYQALQSLTLLDGKQLYTKDELVSYYPEMKVFLYRQEATQQDYINLNSLFDRLVNAIYNRSELGLQDLNEKEVQ